MRLSPGLLSESSLYKIIREAALANIEIKFIDEPEPSSSKMIYTNYVEIYNNYRIDQAYRAIENKLHDMKVKRGWFDVAKIMYEQAQEYAQLAVEDQSILDTIQTTHPAA